MLGSNKGGRKWRESVLRLLWEGGEEGRLTLDFDDRLLLLKVSCKFMSNY